MLQLEALQRVQVVHVFDIYEMLRALQELRDGLSQQVRGGGWAPSAFPRAPQRAAVLLRLVSGTRAPCPGAVSALCSSGAPEVLALLPHLADGACFQVVSSVGPLKVVVIDSVSAVIYPLLGGRQAEGELLPWAAALPAAPPLPGAAAGCGCDCSQLLLCGWMRGGSLFGSRASCWWPCQLLLLLWSQPGDRSCLPTG